MSTQNIFDAHAEALSQYQAETVAGQNNPPSVNQPGGGTIVLLGATYAAIVQPFEVKQVLVPGGWESVLRSTALVVKSILPVPSAGWRTGVTIQATPPQSQTYNCKIISVMDKLSFWEIEVESIDAF